jgi:coiled-coil domain-containing protein 130
MLHHNYHPSQNTRYVVVSGARQKDEEWNPEENGGFAIYSRLFCSRALIIGAQVNPDPDKEAGESNDPLVALEKTTDAQRHMETVQKPRIESLQGMSEHYNSDPYSLSLKVRKRFREEKKVEVARRQADDTIKGRYGLPATLRLLEDDEKAVQDARSQWASAKKALGEQESKRRKISSPAPSDTSTNAVDSLRIRILQNTAKKSTTIRTFKS